MSDTRDQSDHASPRPGDPPAGDRAGPHSRRKQPAEESIKETFESIVIAFVLAFVFRAYVVEAFVIPTGSMAPTLLGEHAPVTCDQCGYQFQFGADKGVLPPNIQTACPMCQNQLVLNQLPSSGDRILVQKYLYSLVEPRRWDVVVFKAPHDPQTNYIKRLVGLPNEQVQIIEGNVYVRSLDDPDVPASWHIARKTDPAVNPQAHRVQNAVWQPIYHSSYVPLDAAIRRWRPPWTAAAGDWQGIGPGENAQRSYHHGSTGEGRLRFDFDRTVTWPPGLHPYNKSNDNPDLPFEDLRISAGFEPESEGLSVQLQTTGRIDDEMNDDGHHAPVVLLGRIDADGSAVLGRQDDQGRFIAFDGATAEVGAFEPGVTREVELWFVDQELSLWVDGNLAIAERFEIDIETVRGRSQLRERPQVAITVQGSAVRLHRVKVDRDLYYLSGTNLIGTLPKGSFDYDAQPVTVLPDQFFCLGDNSPASRDSRGWDYPVPWVAERAFVNQAQSGMVPRRLMMGRAFFVYYPAPFGLSPQGTKLIPNFGDMRFIH